MNSKLNDILKPADGCLSQKQLLAYAEGELPADEMRKVEEHISDCEFCADAMEGIMSGDVKTSGRMIGEINKTVGRMTKPSARTLTLRRLFQAASVAALLVAGVWFVNNLIHHPAKKIFSDEFQPYPSPHPDSFEKMIPPAVMMPADSPAAKSPPSGSDAGYSSDATVHADVEANKTAMEQAPVVQQKAMAPAHALADTGAMHTAAAMEAPQAVEDLAPATESDQQRMMKAEPSGDVSHAVMENHFGRAMELYNGEQYTEAIAEFQFVLQQEPENAAANFYCGISSLSLHQSDEALRYFKHTDGEQNAYYEATLWYQALTWLEKGEKQQARELLESVISLNGAYKTRAEETLGKL